jgi:hypothetical protein
VRVEGDGTADEVAARIRAAVAGRWPERLGSLVAETFAVRGESHRMAGT